MELYAKAISEVKLGTVEEIVLINLFFVNG